MIYTTENTCDVKGLSLQLYGKEVEITLRKNSETSKLLNTNSIKGTLVARVWGHEIFREGHVIALRVRQGIKETEIPCGDIYLLSAVQ